MDGAHKFWPYLDGIAAMHGVSPGVNLSLQYVTFFFFFFHKTDLSIML